MTAPQPLAQQPPVREVTSTDLFVGPPDRPLQLMRMTLAAALTRGRAAPAQVAVSVEGPGVRTPEPATVAGVAPGARPVLEVAVEVAGPHTDGDLRPVTVTVDVEGPDGPLRAAARADLIVAEPGWTVFMVPHFHYDPVWWNPQGAAVESWYANPAAEEFRPAQARTAFDLLRAHLDRADADPDYRFVLAEADYLKPGYDAHPQLRPRLRRLLREGRLELVGGYNEPATNLIGLEAAARNLVYGLAYQREVLGGDPRTAWQLDVFGHDPAYPALAAAAGLGSAALARGPFHAWGPRLTVGDNRRMPFPLEFEWIAPGGRSVLASYLANHYAAGWDLERAETLPGARQIAYRLFRELKPVAATRNVLLPVGADHVLPSRWCTQVQRSWNARYTWPRFEVALPRAYLAAVRAELRGRGAAPSPQSRDLNPVYTGKDVSRIDAKQAQHAAEHALLAAERLAALAWLDGHRHPSHALDEAWRQLLFTSHHDAVGGTGSDQVHADLLGSWRRAAELAERVTGDALAALAAPPGGQAAHPDGAPDPADGGQVLVANVLGTPRGGLVRVRAAFAEPGPARVTVTADGRRPLPALAEPVRRHRGGGLAEVDLVFAARGLPALGTRAYRLHPHPAGAPARAPALGWVPVPGRTAAGAHFAVTADPDRGGGLTSIVDRAHRRELLRPGGVGNEPVLYPEYPGQADYGEGPWHLLPRGVAAGGARSPATVRAERSPLGARLVSRLRLGPLRLQQEVVVWDAEPRVDFTTHVDGAMDPDHLLRVRFPFDLPGALPVQRTAAAVLGRPFGYPGADSAEHPWTLDAPAQGWTGLSSAVRVRLLDAGGAVRAVQAVGVAEVVAPPGHDDAVRDLVARLADQGVTATATRPDGPRHGSLDLDSNLPDVRVVLGGPLDNAFAARVAATLPDPRALEAQLAVTGRAWLPAARRRADAFAPGQGAAGVDVRGPRDLPVLVVGGDDLDAAAGSLAADLADAEVVIAQPDTWDAGLEPFTDHSVALVAAGTPGSVVDLSGALYLSLLRSPSGWPGGLWLADAPQPPRALPDGSPLASGRWSHSFRYSLLSGAGDWRRAGFSAAADRIRLPPAARQVRSSAAHPGDRLRVEPATVAVSALKPATAPWGDGGTDPRGLVVRLVETAGLPVRARLACAWPLRAAVRCDLLEEPLPGGELAVAAAGPGSAVEVELAAGEVLTLRLDLAAERPAEPAPPPPEPPAEVYTRYWLHNTGAAPYGGLPTAVHVSRPERPAEPGRPLELTVTVATSTLPERGELRLEAPPGFGAEPLADTRFALGPHSHHTVPVRLFADGAPPGRHYLAASITDRLGQRLFDVAAVDVGGTHPGPPLEAELRGGPLRLRPGGRGLLAVTLTNPGSVPLPAVVRVVAPFAAWELVGPHEHALTVPAGDKRDGEFAVALPASARPGARWWAMVKVMCAGTVHYTEAVAIEVAA